MDARWFAEDNVQYYATDHLGSTNFIFDSDQRVVSHTEYFPSGEVWRSETASAYAGLNPYSFTGKEWDAITGLYDFGARQYDPRLGQWLSPDPAFDGLNLYAYVHNNPVNMVDPLGLSAEYGRDNPIPVNVEGVREGKKFAWGRGSEIGDYSEEAFDRMTADRPVLQQSRSGLTPEMGDAIGRMGAEARAAVDGLENGGLGPMDTALQAGMMAGAAATGSDIRTDGTGSARGIPGGNCTSCSGGRAWQVAYIGLTMGSLLGGAAWQGWRAVKAPTVLMSQVRANGSINSVIDSGATLMVREHHLTDLQRVLSRHHGRLNAFALSYWRHVLPHRHYYRLGRVPERLNANFRKTYSNGAEKVTTFDFP